MAEETRRRPLLGRLAELGWFARHGEVAATQALAMLLEERQLRDALLRHLEELTDRDLAAVESFQAELIHEDLGRPDLEGQDGLDRPLLVVEAKFGARLSGGQIRAYRTDQERRLGGDVLGALILLVPSYRRPEAEDVLRTLEGGPGEQTALTASVAAAVVAWDEWLDVWDNAANQLPEREQEAVRGDLSQLRALCRAMVGLDIPPLGPVTEGHEWEEREQELQRLVKQVTAQPQFRFASGKMLPVRNDPEPNFLFRYLPGAPPDQECCCVVGVAGGLASEGGTPFWLRYHKDTPGFRTVSERIMESRFNPHARGNNGHLWLPLHVSLDHSGAALADELAVRIEEIRAVAAGSESSPALE